MSDNEIQTKVSDALEEQDGLIAYFFTNHKDQAPFLQQLLDLYYRGAYENTVGIMHALNVHTQEEETLLVGVEHLEDGNTVTYPLARILSPQEAKNYVGPDGEGGWLDDEDEEETDFSDDRILE